MTKFLKIVCKLGSLQTRIEVSWPGSQLVSALVGLLVYLFIVFLFGCLYLCLF